jgi:AcrR family transcriptional regulator
MAPAALPEPEDLRPPQQARSRESLERVLEAGQELLEEKGWEGFTVQEVSRRAKVSIGSIYARAPSKESLILAVYDRAVAKIGEQNRALLENDAPWEGLEPRELIARAVRELGAQSFAHEKILRVFMARSPTDPVIRERGSAQVRLLAERFEGLLLRHKDEITHPNPDVAIDVAFRMTFSTISRRITMGKNWGEFRATTDEQLLEELGRAAAAYLLEPGTPAAGTRAKRRT